MTRTDIGALALLSALAPFGARAELLPLDQVVAALTPKLLAPKSPFCRVPCRIAVVPLSDPADGPPGLGEYVASALTTQLIGSKRAQLIDKKDLTSAAKERNAGWQAGLKEEAAAEIARASGAEGLIFGSLRRVDEGWELEARYVRAIDQKTHAQVDGRFESASLPLALGGGAKKPAVAVAPPPPPAPSPSPPPPPAAAPPRPAAPAAPGLQSGVLSWRFYNVPPWKDAAPNLNEYTPALTEQALNLERRFGNSAPGKGVSADYFSAVADGEVQIETAGTYLFSVWSDDLGTLTVGTNAIRTQHHCCAKTQQIYFDKPGWLPFHFEVHEQGGDAGWAIQWRRPGDSDLVPIASTLVRAR